MRGFYSSLTGHTLGVGVGLRARHVQHILQLRPTLDWFELLADNHMVLGGWAKQQALAIAELYPVTMHCVGMSIAGNDPIDLTYLQRVKLLADEINPKLISDHLCWTSWQAKQSHDLLPFPFTQEALQHVVTRINKIQDHLGVRIAIENISSYLTFKHSTIDEAEFINAVAQETDCNILLDINNIYVNQVNNHIDAYEFLDIIDATRVVEIHLAGFETKENFLLDVHNNTVNDNVWALYEYFMNIRQDIPTLIEWDHDVPEFSVLLNEAEKAQRIKRDCMLQSEQVKCL